MKKFLPLLIFLPLLAVMLAGLQLNPREVPSPLVDSPAPFFSLPQLNAPQAVASPAALKDKVWLLNVWASWCVSCRVEHPLLLQMQKEGVMIVGLNYKDKPAEAKAWLQHRGDPYVFSAADESGRAGLDWGVYGVPETFVIDGGGIVRHKHIGPLDSHAVRQTILPMVRDLQKELS